MEATKRAAGVEPVSVLPTALAPPAAPPTTYCMKHESLEGVDRVEKVTAFIVEEKGLLWPNKTNRSACEVWGFTTEGCSVHFIGGPSWNR